MTIYCFSGTGNTRRVAAWMAEEAARQQVDASVRPINTTSDVSAPGQSADLVGIGMPTHGFTLPWAVLKFLIKLPRGNGRKAFAFATRAGARYGPIPGYPPGIAGSSIFIAALVLALKGYRVRGIMSVNTCPSTGLDHCVELVGWGEEAGTPYWTVRNSWGTEWGESGFVRLERNTDTCGIGKQAILPRVPPLV